MTEHDEVAASISKCLEPCDWPDTLDEARGIVKTFMADESSQIVDNTAEALLHYVRIRRA